MSVHPVRRFAARMMLLDLVVLGPILVWGALDEVKRRLRERRTVV